jgi:hypothetical protein
MFDVYSPRLFFRLWSALLFPWSMESGFTKAGNVIDPHG